MYKNVKEKIILENHYTQPPSRSTLLNKKMKKKWVKHVRKRKYRTTINCNLQVSCLNPPPRDKLNETVSVIAWMFKAAHVPTESGQINLATPTCLWKQQTSCLWRQGSGWGTVMEGQDGRLPLGFLTFCSEQWNPWQIPGQGLLICGIAECAAWRDLVIPEMWLHQPQMSCPCGNRPCAGGAAHGPVDRRTLYMSRKYWGNAEERVLSVAGW